MKAAVFKKYGSPKAVLRIEDKEIPKPKENEVLVKIYFTAINDWDWGMIRGKPLLLRLLHGVSKPKNEIPGMELSGVIESIGKDVSKFQVGDHVYGDISEYSFGTYAEYLCLTEDAIVKKPKSISFLEAAALSHASMLAYQAIYDSGDIKDGIRVLINGAGGGFGTAAFQLLKMHKAEITGVDTGEKLNMMRTMGFDHVLDYKKEDFKKNGLKYDLILDAKTQHSIFEYSTSLNQKGQYITVGGFLDKLIGIVFLNPVYSIFSKKRFKILSLKPNKDLKIIEELYESGKIKFQIDGPYPFSEIAERVQYFGEGKHSGKVIIAVNHLK